MNLVGCLGTSAMSASCSRWCCIALLSISWMALSWVVAQRQGNLSEPNPGSATARPSSTAIRFIESTAPEVEIKLSKQGQPLVRPLVNGRDVGWFILDTGAGAMAITPRAARGAKMRSGEPIDAVGVGGSVRKNTWHVILSTWGPLC